MRGVFPPFRIESDAVGRWWLNVYEWLRGPDDPVVYRTFEATHCPWCGGRLFVEKKS